MLMPVGPQPVFVGVFMRLLFNAILVHLQIMQMLVLPAFAPAMHTCYDRSCSASASASASAEASAGRGRCVCEFHTVTAAEHRRDDGRHQPHNCDGCPVCHVLAAPRIPAVLCCLQLVTRQMTLDSPEPPLLLVRPPGGQPHPRGPPESVRLQVAGGQY
jgi:hypothetical protein